MSHIFSQKDGGVWSAAGVFEGRGYSGHEGGKNNPDAQKFSGIGPIPQGRWFIGPPQDSQTLGPYVMALNPAPSTNTFGRGGFYFHGDSTEHPGEGSHGCIAISPRSIREAIWKSGDHELTVVAEYPFPVPFVEEEKTAS